MKSQEATYETLKGADAAAKVADLQKQIAALKQGLAPAILTTPGIANEDAETLIQSYTKKIGNPPAYLTAVANDTSALEACQAKDLKPGTPQTDAAAQAVSSCMVAYKAVAAHPSTAQKAAPQAAPAPQTPAPVVQTHRQATPVAPVHAATQPATDAPRLWGLTYPELGLGVAVGLAGLFMMTRRRKEEEKPAVKKPVVPVAPTIAATKTSTAAAKAPAVKAATTTPAPTATSTSTPGEPKPPTPENFSL